MAQNSKENFTYFSHDLAVADAMMFAQAYFHKIVEQRNQWKGVTIEDNEQLEDALVCESDEKCLTGSTIALYYLKKNFPYDFDTLVFLRGKMLPDFVRHVRFLAHGNNKWYSASPANHEINSPDSRMLAINSSSSLDGLFTQIKRDDGGIWPEASYIRNVLSQEKPCSSKLSRPGFPVLETVTFDDVGHSLGLHAVPIIETDGLIKLDITAANARSSKVR